MVRFAPSPTGHFHIGNLRTAWISHAWAKALGTQWIVRFEDLDGPRVVSGARERQLADLKALGLEPDKVYVQSERRARHWSLFGEAIGAGRLYPCYCSRTEVRDALRDMASAPHGEPPVYDGGCRRSPFTGRSTNPTIAWRFADADPSGANDFIAARTSPSLPPDEASFAAAYHWACAIDDFDGGYSLIVRAWDLLPALTPQHALQRWLAGGAPHPIAAFHTALVTGPGGERLEKRTRGVTLDELAATGITPLALAQAFSRGFRANASEYAPGKVWGENPRQVNLDEVLR